jgi:hypothetical protein
VAGIYIIVHVDPVLGNLNRDRGMSCQLSGQTPPHPRYGIMLLVDLSREKMLKVGDLSGAREVMVSEDSLPVQPTRFGCCYPIEAYGVSTYKTAIDSKRGPTLCSQGVFLLL